MKLAYRWRCFACDKPNAASATSCASCGFPARATGAEIARAQAAHRIGLPPMASRERPPAASVANPLAGLRGWRLGFLLVGAVLLAIGIYAGNGMLSWAGLGVAVLALIFGSVLVMIAWAARSVAPAT